MTFPARSATGAFRDFCISNETNLSVPSLFVIELSSMVSIAFGARGLVSLEISIRESGGVTILDLQGRSTISDGETELLSQYLERVVTSGVRKLLLNLINLTQVDSSGLSVMVTTYVSLRGKGGEMGFLGPRGRVLEAFKVLHLLEIIPCFDDEAQALAAFRSRGSFGTS